MNVEAILHLADVIEAHPHQFNMFNWGEPSELLKDCGTAGCIGGWADAVFHGEMSEEEDDTGALLGLTPDQAAQLFYPQRRGVETDVWALWNDRLDPYKATADQAAALLRDIALGDAVFADEMVYE